MTPEEIKSIRSKLSLTQIEFANLLGTTQIEISRWENGAHKISKSYQKIIKLVTDKERNIS